MARLGKRERAQRKQLFEFMRSHVRSVVAANLAAPRPERSLISRDETAMLKLNSYYGFSLGQRKLQEHATNAPWVKRR